MAVIDQLFEKEIVSRVFSAVTPNKIFLFGSAASDEMGPDSDIDLLVVAQEVDNPRALSTQIRRQLRGLPFPFDILVRSQDQFDRFKDVVGSVFYTAIRHGRVLYGEHYIEVPFISHRHPIQDSFNRLMRGSPETFRIHPGLANA